MLFRLVTLLLILLIIELSAWVMIWLMPDRDFRRTSEIFAEQSEEIRALLEDRASVEMHPVLGWRSTPNFRDATNQINSLALRSTREYTARPEAKVLRVAVFGDSYAYGNEVANSDAWAAVMEQKDPELEVLNYGVGGYGIDQSFLRYTLEGAKLHPHLVILVFTTYDLGRVTSVFRRFLDTRGMAFFKPRYLIDEHGELKLLAAPVRNRQDYEELLADPRKVLEHGQHDQWYPRSIYENPAYDYSAAVRAGTWVVRKIHEKYLDPDRLHQGSQFNTQSTAFRINAALVCKFASAVESNGAVPLVLFLPEKDSVQLVRSGEPTTYQLLLDDLRQAGLRCLDAAEAFQAQATDADVSSWFAPRSHYTAAGNQIVATWLLPSIKRIAAERLQKGSR